MKHTYTPPPLRESYGKNTAADIQRDIDIMRKMYAERRNMNQPRGVTMMGYSILTVIFVAPLIAAVIYHILK